MEGTGQSSYEVAFLSQKIEELAKKAKLSYVPGFCISKVERFASVNVFRRRLSIGKRLLTLWRQGNFSDEDIEATLAHEIGHLMDFDPDSHSHSFRNLMFESLWFSFGIVPLVSYLLYPSLTSLGISVLLALGWGLSIPWIIRQVEIRIELEADRNAAVYLVEPTQLTDALVKISSFSSKRCGLGIACRLLDFRALLTHPSFTERVRYIQSLTI